MGGVVSQNHTTDCAFEVSFGDQSCDCDGPSPTPAEVSQEARLEVAQRYLAEARAALNTPTRRPA